MINNQSDKPEKFEPQDSERKEIDHIKDDNEAVVKPEDLEYKEEEVDFGNIEESKAENEQPINSIDEKPKKEIYKGEGKRPGVKGLG